MSANATTAAPTGRKRLAQGKERSDDALGHDPQNTSSPETAKESDWRKQLLAVRSAGMGGVKNNFLNRERGNLARLLTAGDKAPLAGCGGGRF